MGVASYHHYHHYHDYYIITIIIIIIFLEDPRHAAIFLGVDANKFPHCLAIAFFWPMVLSGRENVVQANGEMSRYRS